AGIIEQARRREVEVIVMGAEPPSRVRGGAIFGGIGAARPEEIGRVTEYVMRKAPCRVLLTAPPEGPADSDKQAEVGGSPESSAS
ncbi:MAG: universal stress protein, partial [Solirubrobacterales bacterium]